MASSHSRRGGGRGGGGHRGGRPPCIHCRHQNPNHDPDSCYRNPERQIIPPRQPSRNINPHRRNDLGNPGPGPRDNSFGPQRDRRSPFPAPEFIPASASVQPGATPSQQQNDSSLQISPVSTDTLNDVAGRLAVSEHAQRQVQDGVPIKDVQELPTKDLEAEKSKMITKYGLRTNFAQQSGRKVIANFLSIPKCPDKIYVYDVSMLRPHDQSGRPNPVKKQWDMLAILRECTLQNAAPSDSCKMLRDKLSQWVTDGTMVWSTLPLFSQGDPAAHPTAVELLETPLQYENECGTILTIQQINIKYRQTIQLNANVANTFFDNASSRFKDSTPNILVKGLNAFFARHARRQLAHPLLQTAQSPYISVGAAKTFHTQDPDANLTGALRAKHGFFLSVRPGVEETFINLTKATSPFIGDVTVQQFLSADTERSDNERQSCLRGVKVEITYRTNKDGGPSPRRQANSKFRFIKEIGRLVGDERSISRSKWPNSNVKSVADWYSSTSPYATDPEFPVNYQIIHTDRAVNVGKSAKDYPNETEWYPASALHIVGGQPFCGRLLAGQVTNMITAARTSPSNHRNILMGTGQGGGLHHFGFNDGTATATQNGLLDAGMAAGLQLTTVPARWIPNLMIQYGPPASNEASEAPVLAKDADWNLRESSFYRPVKMDALYVVNHAVGQSVNTALLRDKLMFHGVIASMDIRVAEQRENIQGNDPFWETKFASTIQELVRSVYKPVLLVILRDNNQERYASIKRVCDVQLGVPSVCVVPKNLQNPQSCSNIAMKFNIRLGGVNHVPVASSLQKLRNEGGGANTIVLGADVTHPSPGGPPATPSIAAVVGSVDDDFAIFPGSMRLQKSRKEDIVELTEMVKERLLAWAVRHDNKLPENVLLYRDGVSESQYDILRRRELPQIQIAMNLARNQLQGTIDGGQPTLDYTAKDNDDKASVDLAQRQKEVELCATYEVESYRRNAPMKLTYVVVTKRHNTRFYTDNGNDQIDRDKNQNVKPGLVVDGVITHPFQLDFYLQSHKPITGLGRSAHYTALRNEMSLAAVDLQDITHAFCFIYAKATKGVSYCAPAYYADRLCDRGRAYLRSRLLGRRELTSPEPAFDRRGETWAAYCDRITKATTKDPSHWNPRFGTAANPWHPDLDGSMFYL